MFLFLVMLIFIKVVPDKIIDIPESLATLIKHIFELIAEVIKHYISNQS